jgi:nucleotidyltransferase/DNA polymerase involved in DNA repair
MKPKHELMSLKNLGQATYQDLTRLGITSIADLAKADPDELYRRIQVYQTRWSDTTLSHDQYALEASAQALELTGADS